MLPHDMDRAVLAHMIEGRGEDGGFSAVFEALALYAAAREEKAPEGPERDRWGAASRLASRSPPAAPQPKAGSRSRRTFGPGSSTSRGACSARGRN